MSTKYSIAEQILGILNDGDVSAGSGLDLREIMLLVGQAANTNLKAEYYALDLAPQEDGREAKPHSISTYPNVPVEKYKAISRIKLPFVPMKLLMGMGVFDITVPDDPFGELTFIPVPAGAWNLRQGVGLLSPLMGQIGYIWEGAYVYFTQDLPTQNINSVDVKLVGVDVMSLGEYDPLPLTADMEADVIRQVLNVLTARGISDKVVDSTSDFRIPKNSNG